MLHHVAIVLYGGRFLRIIFVVVAVWCRWWWWWWWFWLVLSATTFSCPLLMNAKPLNLSYERIAHTTDSKQNDMKQR